MTANTSSPCLCDFCRAARDADRQYAGKEDAVKVTGATAYHPSTDETVAAYDYDNAFGTDTEEAFWGDDCTDDDGAVDQATFDQDDLDELGQDAIMGWTDVQKHINGYERHTSTYDSADETLTIRFFL